MRFQTFGLPENESWGIFWQKISPNFKPIFLKNPKSVIGMFFSDQSYTLSPMNDYYINGS